MEKYVLRKYQREAVNKSIECLKSNRKGLTILPCGAGKSLIAAKIAEELSEPIVILQPSKELLIQNYSKFKSFGGEATIYCSSLKTKTIDKEDYTLMPDGTLKKCKELSKITFATIGSIKKETSTLKKAGLKYLIIDEVNIGMKFKKNKDTQLRTFIKNLGIKSVIGLTATAIHLVSSREGAKLNMMNRTQATMFRQIVHLTQINELVEKGFWAKLIYNIEKTNQNFLELNSSGSDFTELSQKIFYKENSLHTEILKKITDLREEGRKKIVVFMPSIDEAQELYMENPRDFSVVHSKMSSSKRDYMVKEFREGKRGVVINCNILATGFDEPEIDAVIMARPTNSIVVYYQALGRGVRTHPKKQDCKVIDFSGNFEKFGKLEDLVYKDIPNYGWALVSGQGQVITGFPLESLPNEEDVIKAYEEKLYKVEGKDKTLIMPFGKYKDQSIRQIGRKNKGYLIWLSSDKFVPYTQTAKTLKDSAKKELLKIS